MTHSGPALNESLTFNTKQKKLSNSVKRCCDSYSKTTELRRFVTNKHGIIKLSDIFVSSVRLAFSLEALSVYIP